MTAFLWLLWYHRSSTKILIQGRNGGNMTIYLDIVILENLIMNSIIIYASAIILKIQIKHMRIFMASSIRSHLCSYELYIQFHHLF